MKEVTYYCVTVLNVSFCFIWRLLGMTNWEFQGAVQTVSLNAVWQLRWLAEVPVFAVTPYYFVFCIEKYFRVQNCNKGFLSSRVLVENSHAARTKPSCFRFYFEYLFVYLADVIVQKSSCQGFKSRTVQSTMKLLSRFVASEGNKEGYASRGCSAVAPWVPWFVNYPFCEASQRQITSLLTPVTYKRENLYVSWNLAFGFKYFLTSFLLCYSTKFLCIRALDIISLVVTASRGWELFWLLFLFCNAGAGLIHVGVSEAKLLVVPICSALPNGK